MLLTSWLLDCEDVHGLPCQAPCSLYSVLLENKLIPDPFYGENDKQLTALSEKGCTFSADFDVPEDLLCREHIDLIFHGLDTLCRITLNGETLADVKNMHRSYTFPVKNRLHAGGNTLRLDFASPIAYYNRRQARHFIQSDANSLPGISHLRKAYCQSGWDWAPALPDMGIFRPVELNAFDGGRITSILTTQEHRAGEVRVNIQAETRFGAGCELFAVLDGQRIRLEGGAGSILIHDPKLWWVRGCGEQPLYTLTVELMKDGQVLDRQTRRIGLRTLTVSTADDPVNGGSEFCFVLNGVKIFAMGANYIPQDSLFTRVTPDRLRQMMPQCVDANFNCLRVWGGGYYPDDLFYDLCDENGILVWQDFMVACSNVWLTADFEEECRKEAEENLRRIQHHACLGLLSGNNEMEGFLVSSDYGKSELVRMDYLNLYEHILPEIAEKLAPDTFYWPSSPSSGGGFDDPEDPARGDTHYWAVWHGGLPFTAYRAHRFRFCSEYGFESFPSMKTIRTFCPEDQMNAFSRVMEDHQKCKGGNSKILRYLADNYLYPHSFENLVYASQLLQADAIKYGVEHFRRQRGYCMGSVYWQFNDCWPVASWSSVDYFGRYKALHYAARKFYAPVALGLFLEHGTLSVNVSNETRQAFRGRVHLSLCRTDFTVLKAQDIPADVEALTARDLFTGAMQPENPHDTFLCADLFDENGAFLMRQVEFFVPRKHFDWKKPALSAVCTDVPGGVEIAVRSDTFAAGVFLDFEGFDCVLSDNYFALTSEEPYRVTVRTDRRAGEIQKALVMKSIYDIR